MREIRPSGSEGGGAGTTGPPYPYSAAGGFGRERGPPHLRRTRTCAQALRTMYSTSV